MSNHLVRRLAAAVASALVVGLAYGAVVSTGVDFLAPASGVPLLGLIFGAALAVPAAAWALARWGVHALVWRLHPAARTRPDPPPSLGRAVGEALAVHVLVLVLCVLGSCAEVGFGAGPMVHENSGAPGWKGTDPAMFVVALCLLSWAAYALRRLTDRALARGLAGLVAGLLVVNGVEGWALQGGGGVRRAFPAGLPVRREATGLRVIILGLDGASWNILDPMMAAGDMPTLARMTAAGARAHLASETPYQSPVCWTTITTGRPPEEHRVLGYKEFACLGCRFEFPRILGTAWLYPFRVLTTTLHMLDWAELHPMGAGFCRAETLWETVSGQGGTADAVDCHATYPAAPIRGCIVSDAYFRDWMWMFYPTHDGGARVWPPEEAAVLDRIVTAPERFDPEELRGWGDFAPEDWVQMRTPLHERQTLGDPRSHLSWLTAVARNVFRVGLELATNRPADLLMLQTEVPDSPLHFFAPYRWPDEVGDVDPAQVHRFQRVVNSHHRWLDAQLAPYAALADERTVLLLVSDHGFRLRRFEHLQGCHSAVGMLLATGGPIRKGLAGMDATLYDVTPTVLYLLGFPVPADLRGRVMTELIEPTFLAAHPPRLERATDAR